jgi:hypothetical protein
MEWINEADISVTRWSGGWLCLTYATDGALLRKIFQGHTEREAKDLFIRQICVWGAVVPRGVEESVIGRNRRRGPKRFEGRLTAKRIN